MLKKDYKAHVAANQFDLTTLLICGARTCSGAYVSTRATFVMADVNAMVEPLQGQLNRPLERVTIAMFTALELKKSSPYVSW